MMKCIELLLHLLFWIFFTNGVWNTLHHREAVVFYLLAGVYWLILQPVRNKNGKGEEKKSGGKIVDKKKKNLFYFTFGGFSFLDGHHLLLE